MMFPEKLNDGILFPVLAVFDVKKLKKTEDFFKGISF